MFADDLGDTLSSDSDMAFVHAYMAWQPHEAWAWALASTLSADRDDPVRMGWRAHLLAPSAPMMANTLVTALASQGRWDEVRSVAADLASGTRFGREGAEYVLALLEASENRPAAALRRILALIDSQRTLPVGVIDNLDMKSRSRPAPRGRSRSERIDRPAAVRMARSVRSSRLTIAA